MGVKRTLIAEGVAGFAQGSAMEDEPVMCVDPKLLGNNLH